MQPQFPNSENPYKQDVSSSERAQKTGAESDTYFDLPVSDEQETVRHLEGGEKLVIPLAAETFTVEKHESVTGVVRIHKTVAERQEVVDTPTFSETVEVERVPRGEWLEAVPQVRYEGQTMIIPVVEEVMVVQKRLRLREELHVTKRRVEETTPQTVTLRHEEVSIDRNTPPTE